MTTSNQIDWLTSLCEQVDLAWMNCYLFYRFIGAYPLYSPWNTICQKGWFWLHELASQPSKQQVEVKSPSHREITQCGVIRYIQMDGWWWIKLFCERAVGIARFFSATSMRRSFRWKTNAQQALLTPNCWEIPSIPPSFFFFHSVFIERLNLFAIIILSFIHVSTRQQHFHLFKIHFSFFFWKPSMRCLMILMDFEMV